ncbi:MAG TPA: hypothetical protein V6C76_03070 [Drouetiella sp.]
MKIEFKELMFDVTTTVREYSDVIFELKREGWSIYKEGQDQVWKTTLFRLSTEPAANA